MKTFKILVALLIGQFTFAQESIDSEDLSVLNQNDGKNLVKVNVLALAAGNFSLQYERSLTKRITVGVTANYSPNRKLPFTSEIDKVIEDESTVSQLKTIEMGGFSITPEARIYLGKGHFKGFYVAPFVRYAEYSLKFPLNYSYEGYDLTLNLDGKISSISGGLAIGAQWKIAKSVYLDWMIMGPHYGSASGNLADRRNLVKEEQLAIKQAINGLQIPFIDYESTVSDEGIDMKVKSPWAGLRASVGIGYRF